MSRDYREEISTLKTELAKKSHEADRYSDERADLDRRKSELHSEVVLSQSKLREAEASIARYEKDIERLTKEVDQLKEQSLVKDGDWRNTINSLNEIQRQALEEKTSLRAELL